MSKIGYKFMSFKKRLPFSNHSVAIPLVSIYTILYNVIDGLQRGKPNAQTSYAHILALKLSSCVVLDFLRE